MESKKRSVIKTLSWRLVATCATILIALLFTGNIKVSAGIGILEVISKLFLYYQHERLWSLIKWGFKDTPS